MLASLFSILGVFILWLIYDDLCRSLRWKKWASSKSAYVHNESQIEIKIEVVAEEEVTSILSHTPYDKKLQGVSTDCRSLVNEFDHATVSAAHISQVDCLGMSDENGNFPKESRKATINLFTRVDPVNFKHGDCMRAIEKSVNEESRVDSFETVWIDGVKEPEKDLRIISSDQMSSDNYNRAKDQIEDKKRSKEITKQNETPIEKDMQLELEMN